MRKLILNGCLLFLISSSYGQVIDNFGDGNFSINPTWTGDHSSYEVDTLFLLHLNAPSQTDTSYLSTPSSQINNVSWQFFIQMSFNPSSSNYAKIYLVSDQANLKGALNGYFIKIGNTSDEISLYRQDGLVETEIIDGIDDRVDTNPVNSSIRVTRDHLGNWQVFSDTAGGNNFVLEGFFLDNTHTLSNFFGVSSRYTSTRSDLFFYDNFEFQMATVIDTTAPLLDSLTIINSTELNLHFNEPVDLASSQTLANYTISGVGNPTTILRDFLDSSVVHLTFTNALINGQNYTLSINNVEDTVSNAITSISFPFSYLLNINPDKGDVMINEIFADPNPPIGLPSEEFVELYNRSSNAYCLKDWQFVNSNTAKNLPNFILNPNSYVILCDINDTSLYTPYGDVIGINTFTALTNVGDSLSLINKNNQLLDAVSYNINWYLDPLKKDGGWTLERINPLLPFPCNNSSNWIASQHFSGGTPGSQNSVFDSIIEAALPLVHNITINTPNEITIAFNEIMDSSSLSSSKFMISNGILVNNIVTAHPFQTVNLTLSPAIINSVEYSLTITGAHDCVGNPIDPDNTNMFALSEQGDIGDLIINEVLFNPFSGGSDFVEIYNNSNKFIDLQNWNLANLENDRIDNLQTIIDVPFIVRPNEFVLLSTDIENIEQEYLNSNATSFLEMGSFPSYGNESGSIYLINNLNIVIDNFNYNEEMHFALLNSTDGVSLERINYNSPTNDNTNWHSAASDIGFATPGFKNSQFQKSNHNEKNITIMPQTFSPNNDGIEDVVNIGYNFNVSGAVANIIIYDIKGNPIRNLVRNELLSTSGTFYWDGVSDDNKKARIGIYVIYFEVFDLNGNVKMFKKTTVLGGKLN